MSIQEYLPFFQDLLQRYYLFTLENSVYAVCLGVSVWLLTAILYSFSIAGLNKKIRKLSATNQDAQTALNTANEHIQNLQTEVGTVQYQLNEVSGRNQILDDQLKDLTEQLSASISGLAAQAELGQQGLTVREGLDVNQLWQRYHAAVKQISERLISELKTNDQLQQTIKSDAATISEKDLQVQAAQMRAESLKQQIIKLEVSLQEQQAQLTQERGEAEQRFAALESQYKADLAKLAVVEAQFQADHAHLSVLEQQLKETQLAQKPVVTTVTPVVTPQVETPIQTKPIAPVVASVSETIAPVKQISTEIPEPEKPIVEVKPNPDKSPEPSSSTKSFGGKFKSLLGNAKSKIEKLDEKMGTRTPLPAESEEPEFLREPEIVNSVPDTSHQLAAEPIKIEEPVISEIETKRGNPLKNIFGSKKTKTVEQEVEKPVETFVEIVAEAPDNNAKAGLGGKFKNLLGGNKTKAQPESLPETAIPVPEPEAPTAEVVVATPAANDVKAKLTGLLGRFKK